MSTIDPKLVAVKCLTPDCKEDRRWKGLCSSCYGQAKRLIETEETTWDELEKLGLAELPGKAFTKAFKRRKYQGVEVNIGFDPILLGA